MAGKCIRVLTVRYDGEISAREVHLFRGAVIGSMEGNGNILFHNHDGTDKFRYSYPLIQYKRIGKKAAIVCVEEGTNEIARFLEEERIEFVLGKRKVRLNIDNLQPRKVMVEVIGEDSRYRLKEWLPLNGENYKRYVGLDGISDRADMLERILKGNILSMCKGLGIKLEEEISVRISQMSEPKLIRNKNTKLMSFDIEFTSNVSLPNYIGLGKNASIGYGVVERVIKVE